jgi:S-layer homology domain.
MYGPDYAPPPAVGIFADVEISDTNNTADYIEQLYNDGIVNGCSAGPPVLYCPNDIVNRAQMAKFLALAFELPILPATGYFTDVTGVHEWAAPYAEALFEAGITLGCGPQIYCPGNNITRAELAVMLVRGLGLDTYDHPDGP